MLIVVALGYPDDGVGQQDNHEMCADAFAFSALFVGEAIGVLQSELQL